MDRTQMSDLEKELAALVQKGRIKDVSEAFVAGATSERGRLVAWMRATVDTFASKGQMEYAANLRVLADAVEEGVHRGEP